MTDDAGGSKTTITRRTLLGSLAATASVGLAGCSEMTSALDDQIGGETGGSETAASGGPPSADGDHAEAQIWPVDSDASNGECRHSGGGTKPATGPDSAPWFAYGGCGSWKTYPVVPGETYWILGTTDGGVLTEITYEVQERVDGTWETQRTVDGPTGGQKEDMQRFVPETDRVRLANRGAGFYAKVYGPVPE